MRKSVTQDDLLKAFATIARYLADSMREASNENAAGDTSPAYYDARTAPTGPTTFRRAAAAGAFPSFKIGRKLMARRADVDAWIATAFGPCAGPSNSSRKCPSYASASIRRTMIS